MKTIAKTTALTLAAAVTTTLVTAPLAPPALSAQEGTTVQIPEGTGSYPTGSLLIQNLDSIWTAAGEVIAGGSILIQEGVIRAIGPNVSAPGGVQVVDGRGLTAIPGLVDEHTHTAMRGTNESTAPIVPEVRVIDGLDPGSFGIYRALSGGITSARVMHGSSNPIGGQSAVIKMRWGMDASHDLLIPGAPRFVKFALGENVTRKGRTGSGPTRFPASRPGVESIYVQAFTAAQQYKEVWEEYRADPSAFRVPPRKDLRMEALVDIMEGRIKIHAHSYRSDEILMLMRVAERFGFKIDVFTHVLEGYKVADEMAAHGAGGSTFSDWWQYKLEAFDAIPHNAAIMHEHGVLTSLNTDIGWLQTFFFREFQKPVKYGGVAKEIALQMVTLNPAKMLGIDSRVGSLEVGKEGDVVLMSGDPFDSYSRVEKTIVDGIVYFDVARERETRGEPFNAVVVTDMVNPMASSSREDGDGIGSAAAIVSSARIPDDWPRHPGSEDATLAPGQEAAYALVGGTVHPVSGPAIENGVVVFQGGRITAVGPAGQVQVPAGAERVDASGRHVYPGMIDPSTTLGLMQIGSVPTSTDVSETGTFNPHIRAYAGIMPHGPEIWVARANGITASLTAQSGGLIEGTGTVIQHVGDTFEKLAIESDAALMVNFPAPSNPGGGGFGFFGPGSGWEGWEDHHEMGGRSVPPWYDPTLAGLAEQGLLRSPSPERALGGPDGAASGVVGAGPLGSSAIAAHQQAQETPTLDSPPLRQLVDFFERAEKYAANPVLTDDPTERFEANIRPNQKVVMDAMVPVVTGEMPVFFSANTEWQIRTLFVFLDRFPRVKGVVYGGSEAYKVADELATRAIPVIVTSTYSPTGNRDESIFAAFRNPAILNAAGVTFAFSTGDNADVRNLPYHAAQAVAFGLPVDAAYRAVSLGSAEILGLGHVMGSIEAGKRADLILTTGDPLQVLTQVERMWINGIEVDPRDNKHDELYREFVGR